MLRCDELPDRLITADVSMMGVTSLEINSSHHKLLKFNALYTIVTSDEFFNKGVKGVRVVRGVKVI